MTPHLVKWHRTYGQDGLVVVEIDNGRKDSLTAVQSHIEQAGILFPVLHDENGTVTSRFGVQGFPMAFLIDRQGSVVWQGHPTGGPHIESKIKLALGR